MGPMTALFSFDSSSTATAPAAAAPKRSFARVCGDAVAALAKSARRSASDRRMRDQLADLDDALLKDIGIADDELHMIRARRHFTPRAWLASGVNGTWTA
jgi:uncharacterized protein YjiS (DUF1127 family)